MKSTDHSHRLRPTSSRTTWGLWQRPGLSTARQTPQNATNSFTATESPEGLRPRSVKLARLEAALICSGGPMSRKKLLDSALLIDLEEVDLLVDELNSCYDSTGSPFRVERVARGLQLFTRPEYVMWISSLHQQDQQRQLGQAMLETLTIIAYRQPITRADLESVRGVQSSDLIRQLMDRDLVKIVGEEQSLGRPYLYGTTSSFLHEFGLRSLNELPNAQTLRRRSDADNSGADESSNKAA